MSPRSRHIPLVAKHIVEYLHMPDLLFVQEIQSDSGSRNNGVVSANKTLSTLVQAINRAAASHFGASGAPFVYNFVNIPPKDNMDGGKPGSNIRVAYLYVTKLFPLCSVLYMFSRWNPNKVSLLPGHVAGSATQDTKVVQSDGGEITLR